MADPLQDIHEAVNRGLLTLIYILLAIVLFGLIKFGLQIDDILDTVSGFFEPQCYPVGETGAEVCE